MATFNIGDFRSEIESRGIIRSHSFVAAIGIPNTLSGAGYGTLQPLQMRCESANIPDVSLATQEILRYGYGPMESIPYSAVFSGTSLTFLLDKKSYVYKFFYSWINSIVNFNTSKGMGGLSNIPGNLNSKPYEVGYKKDYTTTITVWVYDEQGKPVMQTTMYRAYPRAINAIDLNWGSTDDLVRLNVSIAFRDYATRTDENIEAPKPRS